MNEDVKDLLQMIKNGSKYLDSRLTIDGGCCKCLLEYIDGLKERIEYLERSNNRREETIIDLRGEQQLDLYKNVIEEVKKYLVEENNRAKEITDFHTKAVAMEVLHKIYGRVCVLEEGVKDE